MNTPPDLALQITSCLFLSCSRICYNQQHVRMRMPSYAGALVMDVFAGMP